MYVYKFENIKTDSGILKDWSGFKNIYNLLNSRGKTFKTIKHVTNRIDCKNSKSYSDNSITCRPTSIEILSLFHTLETILNYGSRVINFASKSQIANTMTSTSTP